MKLLISAIFLFVCASAFGANPAYDAFRGAGGITVTSNPPNGTIVIDGSGVVASGTNSSIRASTNGTTVSAAATNINYTAGTNLVVRGTNIGSTAHINYRLADNVNLPGGLSVNTTSLFGGNVLFGGTAEFNDDVTFNNGVIIPSGAASGYVLTSDGSGAASWGAPSIASNANLVFVDVGGNNSTAKRGRRDLPYLTPVAAKAAAVAGDTIVVFPGQYNNATNLLKNGVNWLGYNALLTYTNRTNDGGVGIFDDRFGGAVTSIISGFSILYSCGTDITNSSFEAGFGPTNVLGPVVLTNSLSIVSADFGRIYYDDFIIEAETAALCLFGGRGHIKVNEIIDVGLNTTRTIGFDPILMEDVTALPNTIGTWWKNGEWHVTVGRNLTTKYGIYFHSDLTNDTGNFWYSGDYMLGKLYGATSTLNQDWKSWVKIKEVRVTNVNDSAASFLSTGNGIAKFYLEFDKLGSVHAGAFDVDGGIEVWLNAQKISSPTRWLDIPEGIVHATVQEFQDIGAVDRGIYIRGGTLGLLGTTCTITNTVGSAVYYESGTAAISGMRISALNSTNSPVLVTTNGLVLEGCTMLAKSGVFSVLATTSKQVNLQGCWGNTPETNNIAYLVGPWTVDSNVR